jgi:HPt (histidine-containing phosphotransfer) domain-containing protein
MANPAISLAHLDQQTFGDADLRREILGLFLRQSVKLIDIMRETSEKEATDLAHLLKGSARAIGAFAVSDAADLFEQALGIGASMDDFTVQEALAALCTTVDHANAQVRHLLADGV